VRLTLAYLARSVRLSIQDDGRGFDSAEAPPDHFDLVVTKERAAEIGARFSLESRPGGGTRLDVEAPLAATARGGAIDG
jgi:signal transduction histidine kinase